MAISRIPPLQIFISSNTINKAPIPTDQYTTQSNPYQVGRAGKISIKSYWKIGCERYPLARITSSSSPPNSKIRQLLPNSRGIQFGRRLLVGAPSQLLPEPKSLKFMRVSCCKSMDTVVVLDFDLTIIDCDSDTWVMEHLGVSDLFNSLLPTIPWNPLMDKMMGELHEQGKSISDIEGSLRKIPLYPETIGAIKFAFSLGCDLRIVSDGNSFFIRTILETHDLLQYFTEIKANPAYIEEDGRLRICPFHPFTLSPHGCSLCPPNMCKGAVIEKIQKSMADLSNKRFMYLGDGSGDFCPTLKLREGDYVLPRKDYPLWKLIEKNPDLVKAQVHGWSDAKDMEDLLMKLLKP